MNDMSENPVATAVTQDTILVVDDTRLNLMVLSQMLKERYQVLQASCGTEALALAAATPTPDLVLLDVMMPGMDGYEVLQELRANPATSEIPVIFITALAADDNEERGLTLGAADYVTKPVRPAILLARVRNQLELKHTRDELRRQNQTLDLHVKDRTAALEIEHENLKSALRHQRELNHKLEDAQNQLLQSEKMASLGQLAAGVAHELNNPISFVHSNLGTLEGYLKDLFEIFDAWEYAATSSPAPEDFSQVMQLKQQKDFDFIKQDIFQLMNESKDGLNRVRKIVQDLKDFSRVGETNWLWSDLHAGLDSTLNIVWNELKYKCTVTKHYAPDLPQIRCLPSQLNQVFMNLLVNAAHSIERQGEITVTTERFGSDAIRIHISDTGTGIAPEHLQHIFEPFFTTKPVGKGTGLGLSLAWGIVGKHHGNMHVASTVGVGTTFTITLPIDPPTDPPNDHSSTSGDAVPPAPTFEPS
jgi:signal transduction histidine kinase